MARAQRQIPADRNERFPCPLRPGHPLVTGASCLRYHATGSDQDTPRESPMVRYCRSCRLVAGLKTPVVASCGMDYPGCADVPRLADIHRVCACCGGMDLRMVVSRGLCISCYNREREIRKGFDRRGNSLTGRSLAPEITLLVDGQPLRRSSRSLPSLTLWVLRTRPGSVISRNVPHGALWHVALFQGLGGRPSAVGACFHGG